MNKPHSNSQHQLRPHPLANEMVDEETQPKATEERASGTFVKFLIGAVLAAIVVAVYLFWNQNLWIVLGGAVLIVLYMMFVMAPVWAARSTKVEQDAAVRGDR